MNTRKNYVVIAIALLSLIALVGSAQAAANLTVTKNHPGYVFSDLTNVMTAYVGNSGTDSTGSTFSVSITVTSDATGNSLYTYKATGVGPLAAGVSEEVNLGNWKPTKVENITINVTADCDDGVLESDETDNSRLEYRNTTGEGCGEAAKYTNTMLEKKCFGYQGQHPLTEAYVGGSDVIYTVGDYKYKNVTVNFEIGAPGGNINRVDGNIADIPDGATIEQATLYMYYCWRRLDTYGYPDFGMHFTNSTGTYNVAEAANYTDWKGFGTSYMRERAYGTVVYDVTDYVTDNGTYTANATQDIWPRESSSNYGYASGMALMVVYDDGSGCKRYRIAHGHDRLATLYQYSATSKSSYHVLPEDATTSATLTDANPSDDVAYAKLFTATVDAVDYNTGAPGKESLKCNDCNWIEGAWSNDDMGDYNYPIGFSRDDVTDCLSGASSDETVQFQERDSSYKNGYGVVFAVLIVEKISIDIRPGSCPNPLELKSKGILPVAVLGTEEFDVTTIDPESIQLNRSCEGCVGVAPIRWSYEDVATPFTGELCDCHDLNGDGYIDLTLKFENQELVETLKLIDEAGNTIPLTLTGNLKEEDGGTPIEGKDCILVLE